MAVVDRHGDVQADPLILACPVPKLAVILDSAAVGDVNSDLLAVEASPRTKDQRAASLGRTWGGESPLERTVVEREIAVHFSPLAVSVGVERIERELVAFTDRRAGGDAGRGRQSEVAVGRWGI